jgi:hypothetical protein
MIYVIHSYNIAPATPATRDRFIDTVDEFVLPSNERHGARLVGAFFANENWFSQIIHVTEFDDLAALGRHREAVAADEHAVEGIAELSGLAPEQHVELVERLGPVATSTLHDAIGASADEPAGTYTFAILDVEPAKMDQFAALVDAAQRRLPIIGCWRDVSGNPNRVTDLWKGDMGRAAYRPSDEGQDSFFRPLREIAPREKMMRLHVLPYSPLQ